MSDEDGGRQKPAGAEGRFTMDPEKVIWELARQLVDGQRSYAHFSRAAQAARRLPESAAARKVVADFESIERSWHTAALPNIIASMQLAIEVLETFGPGRTDVADDIEAMVFNNKYFVWSKELAPAPFSASDRPPTP
jgi:hypothetical protein